MKLNKIKIATLCIGLFSIVSCTGDFENINSNPNGVTDVQLEQDFNNVKSLFTPMFNNIIVLSPEWEYQVQQGLQADIWSGYMATPTPFRGGSNNTTYDLVDGWNVYAWSNAYGDVMSNVLKVEQRAKGKYNQFYALSLILKVEAMHRVTDTYGPIVYSKFGTTDPIIGYDSQEQVYTLMFSELDLAVADLTARVDSNEASTFTGTDISSYNGDYRKWVKFANSLRLRLAMRIVKKNPSLAKTEAEKAISQKYGVMVANDDVFKIVSPTFTNPIATISTSWGDIRMSADMESIMGGYSDPRMAVYFTESIQFPGQYKGVRTGIEIAAKADHVDFSGTGTVVNTKSTVLMNTAEVYLLRAEGALRGWNMGGTAQIFYEMGINASFDQLAVAGASAYVLDAVKTAKAYVDPNFPVNNSAALNNVTVAWNPIATNEVKLQKIITQKWIANFPEGQEAWSDFRRTGYPKLMPVLKNTSGGKIDSNLGVRRVNFVQSEKDGNPGGVATGVSALGGADTGGTRLWWDTIGSNF
jgi:hypothetical protein